MQHIYAARDAMEAHFVKGLLAQEGIESVIEGEPLEETWGGLPLSPDALPSVWVQEADVARAAPIVDEYRRRDQADADLEVGNRGEADPVPPRPTWTCAQCGERVEEQFTQCWHCGHPRPASGGASTALA